MPKTLIVLTLSGRHEMSAQDAIRRETIATETGIWQGTTRDADVRGRSATSVDVSDAVTVRTRVTMIDADDDGADLASAAPRGRIVT